MYTVLMDSNKSLITPKKITVYQGENLVDKINFIIPKMYNNVDITNFTVSMRYVLPGNVMRVENLTKSSETYNDTHDCYGLPLDNKLTTHAGNIVLSLLISKKDEETDQQYQLHTGFLTITVEPEAIRHITKYENQTEDNSF